MVIQYQNEYVQFNIIYFVKRVQCMPDYTYTYLKDPALPYD